MHLSINRELLLKALNLIAKASDKRNNMVILGNIRFQLTTTHLTLTASDLEVELMAEIALPEGACISEGATTLPADKLHNICKLLPVNSQIHISLQDGERCLMTADKSKFTLGTLPADDYPSIGTPENITPLNISRDKLADMINKTQFAMAVQDVRYYLTGMLFDVSRRLLTTVATDGHRLALAKNAVETDEEMSLQAILPRKAVTELERLLNELGKLLGNQNNSQNNINSAETINLKFGREFLQVTLPFGNVNDTGQIDNSIQVTFTARLIDGKFPDYRRVMPSNSDKQAIINHIQMKEVLRRVSILSNEKSRGVLLKFTTDGMIELTTNNAEQDEAVERLQSKYTGEPIELSFNAQYMQDVLEVMEGYVVLSMSQANASVLAHQHGDELHQYVIMPMRV